MRTEKNRIFEEITNLEESMISFLQDLVKKPSTLGNEKGAQLIVYKKLKELGLEANILEPNIDVLEKHPAYAPIEWDYKGRPNVTAIHRTEEKGGKNLVLNGHIDVVSPEPLWEWNFEPWGAEIVDNRLYGRGSADMKGGIAMMILALEAIIKSDIKLLGDVFVETVIEEECGGNGSLACRINGYSKSANAAIIPEPFSLHTSIADLGIMWFRVRLKGTSAHVAEASKHGNVIENCFPLIQVLRELEKEMNADVKHPLYKDHEHPINLNVGTITGGHWPSSVPSDCSFVCRLSYMPDMKNKVVQQLVKESIQKEAQKHSLLRKHPPIVEFYGFQSEGIVLDKKCDLINVLGKAHQAVTNEEMKFVASTGTTDMRYFNLYEDIPATCYGPIGGNIHTSNEFVELDSIITGAKTLTLFILEWCK